MTNSRATAPRLVVISHRSFVIDHFEVGPGLEALELRSLSVSAQDPPCNDDFAVALGGASQTHVSPYTKACRCQLGRLRVASGRTFCTPHQCLFRGMHFLSDKQ